MSIVKCTATFRQGSETHTWEGHGPDHVAAFIAASSAEEQGSLLPNTANQNSAMRLLNQWSVRPDIVPSPANDGYAYIDVAITGQPVISIGWVTYTFTVVPQVRLYAIAAQVEIQRAPEKDWQQGWSSSRQVPTFYLDPTVQGILDEAGAVRVAEDILSTAGPVDDQEVTLHVTATPVY